VEWWARGQEARGGGRVDEDREGVIKRGFKVEF
jgi:hypothetical protein